MSSSSRISGITVRSSARNFQRAQPHLRPRLQYRSYADVSSQAKTAGGGGIVGGLIGGATVLVAGYGYYHFSGAKTAVQTMSSAKGYFQQAKNKVQEQTPEPNQAIEWLHSTALAYAGFIPGAKGYVDQAFKDVESIRSKHGDKVDGIIRDGYEELKKVTQEGDMSIETTGKVWNVIQDKLQQIGELAGDAIEDILNNHPDVKEKVGGNIDQLKQLQEQYGPKVKSEVDKTWEQISSIVSKGVSASTASEIQKVVQEKVELIKSMGDKAYQEGKEQVKPYLEKSPKVKQLIEENEEALKQGNIKELWDKIRNAVESGDTEEIEKYVKDTAEKAKDQGQKYGIDIEKYLQSFEKYVPGSSDIMTKVQQLQKVGKEHGAEAEKIFKSAIDEIKQVLKRKTEEAEKVAKSAKKESK
ncbi:hypothetical protein EJ05DRAFT_538732 [Pseudovirgaria hyperparasitica]|uniref:Uncharacterized protein n=1 Tax=Pseudovirgaria hyperparasitica TaxID=470096 RepID=A0A6A6W4L2_9PEZI|nr:uncharacterized protein EJ05DRAFT_538732 [Pseudovirgaria hyperparasitica]KAF2757553.1 hypothetical protein EJ05DRAFT_538732 [Pseudovirgaria hyperparasitica]